MVDESYILRSSLCEKLYFLFDNIGLFFVFQKLQGFVTRKIVPFKIILEILFVSMVIKHS